MTDDPFGVHGHHVVDTTVEGAAVLDRKMRLLDAVMSWFLWYHPDEAASFVAQSSDPDGFAPLVADGMRQMDAIRRSRA